MPTLFSRDAQQVFKIHPEHMVSMRKLDLALKDGPVLKLKRDLENNVRTVSRNVLETHVTKEDLLESTIEPTLWPVFFQQILEDSNNNIYYEKRKSDLSIRTTEIVKKTLEIQHSWIHSNNELSRTGNFSEWLKDLSLTIPLLSNLLYLERIFGEMVELSGQIPYLLRSYENRKNPRLISHKTFSLNNKLELFAAWSGGLIFFKYKECKYLYQRQFLLLIHNKLCDLISVYLMVRSAEGVCFESGASGLLMQFARQMCNLSIKFGNDFFEISRSLEGLITAEILSAEERWNNNSLINSIHDDLLDIGYYYHDSPLQSILECCSTPFKQELGGLAKLFGHPIIDEKGTALRAYKRATEQKQLNIFAIQDTRNQAVESYIRSFILKHHKWPPVTLDKNTPAWLRYAHNINKDPHHPSVTKHHTPGSLIDYTHIDLLPVKELDKLSHYTQYLKDKTVTLIRSKVLYHYTHVPEEKPKWEETRLLLVYLFHTNDELNITQYLQDYINSSARLEGAMDYLVIKLVPKEKELKSKARLFGCKTYQDRYRGKVQEEAVMNFMNDYVMDQAMTLDDIGLTNRLYKFRNLLDAYKGWKVLYVNFDVSGWCSNFRHEAVSPLAHDLLDAYYGTENFFCKTQNAYQQGLFYIPKQDGSGSYMWEGQEGGVEGLNQDTWMMMYIPQMRYALSNFQAHIFVMAYGDDYKAALLIPPDQKDVDLSTLKDQIVKVVGDSAKINFGQNMKIFDSYGSECYISFCKNTSVRSVELSQGLRKIQKCYGSNNAFLPFLDDYIASAFSNSHSAARYLPISYCPYIVGCFWSAYHLLTHHQYSVLNDSQIITLLMSPSCVGGFPIIFLHNYFIRGESDHLTAFLDLTHYCLTHYPDVGSHMKDQLTFNVMSPLNLETLYRDPYSLPIRKPPLPGSVFRQMVLPTLEPFIRNEDMLELLSLSKDSFSKYVIEQLGSSSILQPRILSSVYACLPTSLVEEFMRRFENATTIKDLLIIKRGNRGARDHLRKVVNAEVSLQKWRISRIQETLDAHNHWRGSYPNNQWCPAQMADNLRLLWGKPIIGVTLPPPQHLIRLVEPQNGVRNPYDITNHFTYEMRNEVKNQVRDCPSEHWAVGPFPPFLGHRTRLGTEIPQVRFIERNPLLSNLSRLLDTLSWVNKSIVHSDGTVVTSNLPELIKEIINQYYTDDPTILTPFASKRKSGSITHHWRCPHFKEFIMPNRLYNTDTWVIGDSNTHLQFRATTDKFHVNFLFLMLYCYSCMMEDKECTTKFLTTKKVWGVTTDCKHCNTPIEEPPIVVQPGRWVSTRPRLLTGVKLDKISQQIIEKSLDEWNTMKTFKSVADVDLSIEDAAYGVCQKFIEQTHHQREHLAVRYNAPFLTKEGMSVLEAWSNQEGQVLIRETEIRHIPPLILARCILNYAFSWMLKTYGYKSLLVADVSLSMTNPRELPWYNILILCEEAGVLGELIHACKDLSKVSPPMVYDNPLRASQYIIQSSIMAAQNQMFPDVTVLLSYYEEDDLSDRYDKTSKNLRWRIFYSSILPLLKTSVQLADMINIESLFHAVVLLFLSPTIDVEIALSSQMRATGGAEISHLFDLEVPDEDTLSTTLEDDNSDLRGAIEIMRKYYEYPLEQISTYGDIMSDAFTWMTAELQSCPTHKFVRATLADCINIIRAQDLAPLMQYRIKVPLVSTGHEILLDQPRLLDCEYDIYFKDLDMPNVETTKKLGPQILMNTDEILLSNHYSYRPYSDGTSTIDKHLVLEACIGLNMDTLDAKQYAFLGEGYGGALNNYATRSHKSHFLYNSLPPQNEHFTFPYIAQRSLEANDHSYDVQLANTGLYDLTDPIVCDALIAGDNLSYHLVSCDAECDWNDPENYKNLLMNVVHFYLTKRTPKGILFLKCFIEAFDTVVECLSKLCHFSRYVRVFRLCGSPTGGELYIVANGMRRMYEVTKPVTIIPIVSRRLHNLFLRMKRDIDLKYPNKEIIIRYTPPVSLLRLKTLTRYFQPYFVQCINATKNIQIDLAYWTIMDPRTSVQAMLHDLKAHEHRLYGLLRTLPSKTTAAEVIMYAKKWIFLKSLLTFYSIIDDITLELKQSIVREEYVKVLVKLPSRCNVQSLSECLFHKNVHWNGTHVSPYSEWVDGINCLLSCRSYVLMIQ